MAITVDEGNYSITMDGGSYTPNDLYTAADNVTKEGDAARLSKQ